MTKMEVSSQQWQETGGLEDEQGRSLAELYQQQQMEGAATKPANCCNIP